jgi:hypothetical protein
MPELKDFMNFPQWSKLIAAAGALIAIGSVSMGRPLGYFLIGLGLLFFGVGETVNRTERKEKETKEGMLGFRMVTVYPWKPTAFGLAMDIIGIGLFLFGIWLVAFAP